MSDDRYPPIGDYGVVADGRTAALVDRGGSIDWCCMPRLDSGSAFGRLLDRRDGGHCSIRPTGDWTSWRTYLDGTLVLATAFRCDGGEVTVFDVLVPESVDRRGPHLVRVVEGRAGAVELQADVIPRFDYGEVHPWLRLDGPHQFAAIGGDDCLLISGGMPLERSDDHGLGARFTIRAGQRVHLSLRFTRPEEVDPVGPPPPAAEDLDRDLEATVQWWRGWTSRAEITTPDAARVLRSAALLRGLFDPRTGAMAAAATTSLPEAIGGERNWDYRYSWIRDSVFAVRSLAEIGFSEEADAFRRFVQRSAAGHADEMQIAYGMGGERRLVECEVAGLEGYRGSRPVRVGNAAVRQVQLDAIGELVNLTWRWHRRGHSPGDDDWRFLVSLVDLAASRWCTPDRGLWEWRQGPRHFVHSKALCWVALDRGLQLANECSRRAPVDRWAAARDAVGAAIDSDGYDEERGVFVQAFGGSDMDAALLLLPVAGYVDWQDERMVRTVEAIREELSAGAGLLYRYAVDDGLEGRDGAFLPCSFWLTECLARQGRISEAREVFDAGSAAANDLGIFSEEADPATGEALGNVPQALTHLSHISAAVALGRAEARLSSSVRSGHAEPDHDPDS